MRAREASAGSFGDLPAISVLPITRTLVDAPFLRVLVQSDGRDGPTKSSQIMFDKPQTSPRSKVTPAFGHMDDMNIVAINRALVLFPEADV